MALTKEAGSRLWMSRWEDWKDRARAKHGCKYAYPSPDRDDDGKINIVCPDHGEFAQLPAKHMYGAGCPLCAGRGTDKLAQLRERFPNWNWDGVVVMGSKQKLTLDCPEHGAFQVSFNALMTSRRGVTPCARCNQVTRGLDARISVNEWVRRIEQTWGDAIRVVPTSIGRCQEKAQFVCSKHGGFESTLLDVTNGHGCPTCGKERFGQWLDASVRVSAEEFQERATLSRGGRYDYDLSTYVDQRTPMRMICKDHGEFWQIPRNHTTLEANCPRCSNHASSGEAAVADYIRSLGFEVQTRVRKFDGKEMDILVEEQNLAVEYCGLYWHGDNVKEPFYHADKMHLAERYGYRLVTVFEDEWLDQQDKVKMKLLNLLGGSSRVAARATQVVGISWKEAAAFLNEHHLQGAGKPAPICHALVQGGRVLAVATWGRERFAGSGALELYRFCSEGGLVVVGGLSKLVKHLVKTNPDERRLVSYADLRWGTGAVYGKAGFTYEGNTNPGYFWCKGVSRMGRHLFQKHKLKDRLKVFDELKSETENCRANGYWKIYDCGHARWGMNV